MKVGDLIQIKETFPYDHWYAWKLDAANATMLAQTGSVNAVFESPRFSAQEYRNQIGEVIYTFTDIDDYWIYIPSMGVYANIPHEFLQILK